MIEVYTYIKFYTIGDKKQGILFKNIERTTENLEEILGKIIENTKNAHDSYIIINKFGIYLRLIY